MTPPNTIEERLRDTFNEVADATRLSPDAWARVNERTRRRRLPRPLLAVAAALGTIIGVTAIAVLVARDEGGPRLATSGGLATSCGSRQSDVDVIVEPKASAGQRDAIRRTLENNSAVAKFSFQSKEESVRIFRCLFADDPEVVATADLTRLPPMFLVTLDAGAEHARLVRRLDALRGVFDVAPRCARRLDIEVYFRPTATPEAILAVRGTLDELPGLTGTVFVSKEVAYQEFACLFAHRPALVEATSPESLPASVRLAVQPGANRSAIVEPLRAHPDVESVIDTRFPVPLPEPAPAPDGSAP